MPDRVYLTVAEVLAIHQLQIEEYGGAHGLRDRGLLESAVFRPQIGYYNDFREEAAALMESLANNHPFVDGNKRASFACMHTFLLVNGYDLNLEPLAAHNFITEAISRGEFRYSLIVDWINRHIVDLR
ncbi:MAG: type II toxin-antitoxin system death-on-curing family toxin [Acidobacteria bacterium]|nr:type II toxin-antitoxin system death-on-curing family toxin [Acidobacteriota bacterium]